MSKIVALLPGTEIYLLAERLIQREYKAIDQIKCVTVEEVITEGRKAEEAGASIIISRGNQANVLKQHTNCEVVEIVLTAQEMAVMVRKAVELSGKTNPTIAIIGWRNMVCDMSYFNKLFDVDLRLYLASDLTELAVHCKRAIDEKVDVVVGDPIVVSEAKLAGIPAMSWMPTEDSLRVAFKTAEKLRTFLDAEATAMAQMNTIMDTFTNGIIRLDPKGTILSINRVMEELIARSASDCIGLHVTEIVNLDSGELQQTLLKGAGSYSTYLRIKDTAVLAVISPVCTGDVIKGAIMFCNQVKGFSNLEGDMLRSQFFKGYVATNTFDHILTDSVEMKKQLQLAKQFAISRSPIMIYGETGTEKIQIAQSIHNQGKTQNGSFVEIDLSGLSSEKQAELLFGEESNHHYNNKMLGALDMAYHGTLFIKHIHCLSLQNQYRLLSAILHKNPDGVSGFAPESDIRIIAESNCDMMKKVQAGEFREDLFYFLNGLNLHIPPLKERTEDIALIWKKSFEKYLKKYDTYRIMTADAMKAVMEYSWPGNIIQLDRLCERLIIGARQRNIGEEHVRWALEDTMGAADLFKRRIQDEREDRNSIDAVHEALEKYEGNRQKTAQELGVSTTTLWRFMKKNGIEFEKPRK